MKPQIIAEEIVDQFFIAYAHQQQNEERHIFFSYALPTSISSDTRRVIIVEVINMLTEKLKDFSIFLENNIVSIRSDI